MEMLWMNEAATTIQSAAMASEGGRHAFKEMVVHIQAMARGATTRRMFLRYLRMWRGATRIQAAFRGYLRRRDRVALESRGCLRAEDEEARRRQARVFGAEKSAVCDPGGGQGLDRAGEVQRRAVHGCFGRRRASGASRSVESFSSFAARSARGAETVPSGANRGLASARRRRSRPPSAAGAPTSRTWTSGSRPSSCAGAGRGARGTARDSRRLGLRRGGAKTPQAARRGARTRANAARGEGDGPREAAAREAAAATAIQAAGARGGAALV